MRKALNKIQWCPGCGDFLALMAVRNALKKLHIATKDVVIISGVGCSGKISHYIDGYAAETLHGRSIPFALGVKLANPHLTVIAIGGDGDGYGIGLGHFLHASRRDIDITYIVLDNENYALTTGQSSPTTPKGITTKSDPTGQTLSPIDPVQAAKLFGASFAGEVNDRDLAGMTDMIVQAIEHPGFAHIRVHQACPSWKIW
jgi:2-oxoglutarate ferredoxin oxidoreductase subunit beta